ncbi:hypothetical protein K3495_g15786 [Podosphaera aphanis]|nr:hypothetical protein K3495_g15786 [Podosphaera aphanis]
MDIGKVTRGEESKEGRKRALKVAAYEEWADSWANQITNPNIRNRASADPETWKAANIYTERNTNQKRLNFKDTPRELHRYLTRAQSSIAT